MITIIRMENLALGSLALIGYHLTAESWWMFLLLILVPDISFAGYLGGNRIGAICYNLAHSWIGPVTILAIAVLANNPLATQLGLIWAAHIGIDRALGYGLKHYSGFKDTHLGKIGKN
jgi:hypothetical protein